MMRIKSVWNIDLLLYPLIKLIKSINSIGYHAHILSHQLVLLEIYKDITHLTSSLSTGYTVTFALDLKS